MGEPRQLRLWLDPEAPGTRRKQLSRWAEAHDVELVFFDPPEHFDDAIVGLVHGFSQEWAVVYDQAKVLAAMQAGATDAGAEVAAEEWFQFNTIGAWVGEATPRFLIRPWEDEGPEVEDLTLAKEETDVEET